MRVLVEKSRGNVEVEGQERNGGENRSNFPLSAGASP